MRHYHARSQSYLQKRPRIRSVARSFAHRKVEGAADDRVSRACPATRYLNPRGHMQPNERTNVIAAAEMPIDQLNRRSLPSPSYSIRTIPCKVASARNGRRVCFLRGDCAATAAATTTTASETTGDGEWRLTREFHVASTRPQQAAAAGVFKRQRRQRQAGREEGTPSD